MAKAPERRITVPPDIWDSLKFYAEDEKPKLSPEIRGTLTPEALAWEILRNHLTEMHHWPPKCTSKGMKRLKKDLDKIERTGTPILIEDAAELLGLPVAAAKEKEEGKE